MVVLGYTLLQAYLAILEQRRASVLGMTWFGPCHPYGNLLFNPYGRPQFFDQTVGSLCEGFFATGG